MNNFKGHISAIQESKSLSIVTVAFPENIMLKTIVVETPDTASYLQKGNLARILFKETEVVLSIGDDMPVVSILNHINGVIKNIKRGVLLSEVAIDTAIGDIVSIVATESVDRLALSIDQKVTALIKMNEIMISQ